MTTTMYLCRHGETEANLAGVLQGQSESDLTPKGRAQAELLATALARRCVAGAAVYSSDLRRAVDTANAVVKSQPVASTLLTDPRLRERRLGALQGRAEKESRRLFPQVWQSFVTESPCEPGTPGAMEEGGLELGVDVRRRVGEALRSIAAAHAGERVVVVVRRGIRTQARAAPFHNHEPRRVRLPSTARARPACLPLDGLHPAALSLKRTPCPWQSHGGTIYTALQEVTAIQDDGIPHIGNCSISTLEITADGAWRAVELGECSHMAAVGNDLTKQAGADWR